MCLKGFLDGPTTAAKAGLSSDQRRNAVEKGLLKVVTKRGEVVTEKTGTRGRPATVLQLTPKGRREAEAQAEQVAA